MNLDGSGVETVVESWSGRRLNSPNDIVARSDGLLYFTDPPYGVASDDRELDFQGVFALTADGELRPVLYDFEKPNGLALSPDERTLYVCDTARYHIRAFEVDSSGIPDAASGRVVAIVDPSIQGGPDGLKVDRRGRLYVAVALGVWVFEPTGTLLGILAMPKRPSNLAWCGHDARTLAITAVDGVYSVTLRVEGVLPPFQPTAA
jgi:gluconolactonase